MTPWRSGGLDLDLNDSAIGMLAHEIDLGSVPIPNVKSWTPTSATTGVSATRWSVQIRCSAQIGSIPHFYSVVTSETVDQSFAANRQRFLTEQGYTYDILDAEAF